MKSEEQIRNRISKKRDRINKLSALRDERIHTHGSADGKALMLERQLLEVEGQELELQWVLVR